MTTVPAIKLTNDVTIPQLGLGLFPLTDDEVPPVVRAAIDAGYRSFDTAAFYGNERGVGRAIAESDIPRHELFLATKLWNTDHGYDSTLRAFDASLDRLKLDYVDLYLIHWPVPTRDRYVESWKALREIHGDGRARAIGVSNFQVPHLQRLLDETGVVPVTNQIELHPRLQQEELRAFHARHGILTEAWSPLAKGGEVLANPTIVTIADKHGRTPAQVILRWHIQLGNVVIPKSANPQRVRENIAVFDFDLDADDLAAIAVLETGERTGPHPDTFVE
ncbi:aldo/keto reductase [Longimycelium tulufanense]|nr:aldo/keto reductase [Longimycelium tulufanense]